MAQVAELLAEHAVLRARIERVEQLAHDAATLVAELTEELRDGARSRAQRLESIDLVARAAQRAVAALTQRVDDPLHQRVHAPLER